MLQLLKFEECVNDDRACTMPQRVAHIQLQHRVHETTDKPRNRKRYPDGTACTTFRTQSALQEGNDVTDHATHTIFTERRLCTWARWQTRNASRIPDFSSRQRPSLRLRGTDGDSFGLIWRKHSPKPRFALVSLPWARQHTAVKSHALLSCPNG